MQRDPALLPVVVKVGSRHVCICRVSSALVLDTSFVLCCRPQPNYRYYILDRNLQPCPLGVPGECYISGVGVSLGYAGQPQLTAERFLPNPFKLPGDSFHFDTMYKTGDILAWLPDGNQRILGRVDLQVKLRGFRVELPGMFTVARDLLPCRDRWPRVAPDLQQGVMCTGCHGAQGSDVIDS